MASTTFATAVVLLAHLAWTVSESGFAKAEDVKDLARLELSEKLDDIYTIICTRDSVDEAIVDRARSLQRMYREVNDDEPYEYDCELLEKLAAARRRDATIVDPE